MQNLHESLCIDNLAGKFHGWTAYRRADVLANCDEELRYIVISDLEIRRERKNKSAVKVALTYREVFTGASLATFKVIAEREGLLQKISKAMDIRQFYMSDIEMRKILDTYPYDGERYASSIVEHYMEYIVDWAIISVRKYHYYNLT